MVLALRVIGSVDNMPQFFFKTSRVAWIENEARAVLENFNTHMKII